MEASLERKLETFWPVRNSELVKRQFPLLSLAVIMDLAIDATSTFRPVDDESLQCCCPTITHSRLKLFESLVMFTSLFFALRSL